MFKLGWNKPTGQLGVTWLGTLALALVLSSGCGNPNEPAIEGTVGAGDDAPQSMEDFYQQQQGGAQP